MLAIFNVSPEMTGAASHSQVMEKKQIARRKRRVFTLVVAAALKMAVVPCTYLQGKNTMAKKIKNHLREVVVRYHRLVTSQRTLSKRVGGGALLTSGKFKQAACSWSR